MTPVIDVAWIGVAGVAIGGIISMNGTAVNGRISRKAAETAIEGEHRQRLREKQSAAYEETVHEVLARQTRREVLTSQGDVGNIGSQPMDETRKHEEPENIRIRSLLLAYASKAVWAAYEAADEVNTRFWVNLASLVSAQYRTQARAEQESAGVSKEHLLPEADYEGALNDLHQAKEDAIAADNSLFDAINRELRWRSKRVEPDAL